MLIQNMGSLYRQLGTERVLSSVLKEGAAVTLVCVFWSCMVMIGDEECYNFAVITLGA